MPRFAVIVIELPLDGGTIEDATVLAEAVQRVGISDRPFDVSQGSFKPYGWVASVTVEDRAEGAMGRASAQAFLDAVDRGEVPEMGDEPKPDES